MAEYSYEQVITALRNADAVGDTEAATRLASIAKGLQQQPKQSQAPSEVPEALGQGLKRALGSTFKLGGELAASGEALFTGKKDTVTLEKLKQKTDQFLGLDKATEFQTIPGIAAETAANVLPFAANLPVAAVGMSGMYNDMVDDLVKKGVSKSDARKAALANIATMTATGVGAGAVAGKVGGGILARFAGGGTGFAGGAEVGRQVQNELLQDYPQAQSEFNPKHAIAQALVGGGLGIAHKNLIQGKEKVADSDVQDFLRQREPTMQEPVQEVSQQPQAQGVRALLPEFKQNQEPILVDSRGEAVPMSQANNLELFKRNAEEQQRVSTLEQPLEFETNLKPYEPQTYLGEATRVEEGLPFKREVGAEKLDAKLEDYKQRQRGFAETQRAFEEGRSSLTKEQAFAEMEKLKAEEQKLDEIRKQLFEEEANNQIAEPSQRSVEIESPQERTTYRPSGQSAFGKSQRGSIGFFGKDTYEAYRDKIKSAVPDATEQEIKAAWDQKQQEVSNVKKTVQQQTGLENLGKVAPSLAEHLQAWRDLPETDALAMVKNAPDADTTNLGLAADYLHSRGRLGVQMNKNPAIRGGIARMSTLIEDAKIQGNRELNNTDTGVNPILRKLETLINPGEAANVFKYIIGKQADPNFDMKLSPLAKEAVKRVTEVNERSWKTMTDLVGKLYGPEKQAKLESIKQDWYFMHSFKGDFVAQVRTKNADGTPGKRVAWVAEDTLKGAKEGAQWYKDALGKEFVVEDPVYVGSRARKAGEKFDQKIQGIEMLDAKAQMLEDYIDLLTDSDPEVQQGRKAVESLTKRRALSSEQMRNRMKVQTGMEGFLGNKPWKSERQNYYDAKDAFETYVNSVHNWKANMEIADFLSKVKDSAPDKPNTYLTLVNQFKDMAGLNRPPENNLVDRIYNSIGNKLGFGKTVSENVAHTIGGAATSMAVGFWNIVMGIQNVIQSPVTMANMQAVMAAKGGKFNPELLASSILEAGRDAMFNREARAEEWQYAMDHEISNLGLVESHAKTKLGSLVKEYVVNKLPQMTEELSRITTFFGTVDYLKANGYEKAEAMEIAKNLTRDYMGNYNDYAKPGLVTKTGAIGSSIGRLQTFAANAFTQYAQSTMLAIDAIRAKDPKLAAPLAMFLATQIAVSGINGTIPMDIAEKLWNGLSAAGLIDPRRSSPRTWMMENYPKASTGALSQLSGLYLDPSFRGAVPFLGLPPVWGIIYKRGTDAANGLGEAMDSLANGKSISQVGKYELVNSVTPAGWRGVPEQGFLTGKDGKYFSTREIPSYTPSKPEGIHRYTNLRSLERGVTNDLGFQAIKRESKIYNKAQDIEKGLEQYIAGQVRSGLPIDRENVRQDMIKIFELAGPSQAQQAVGRLTKLAEQAGYDNSLVADVVRTAEKNPFKAKRLLGTLETIKQVVGR